MCPLCSKLVEFHLKHAGLNTSFLSLFILSHCIFAMELQYWLTCHLSITDHTFTYTRCRKNDKVSTSWLSQGPVWFGGLGWKSLVQVGRECLSVVAHAWLVHRVRPPRCGGMGVARTGPFAPAVCLSTEEWARALCQGSLEKSLQAGGEWSEG